MLRVYAIDVNGKGPYSGIVTLQACIPPMNLEQPYITSIKKTKFTMKWSAPELAGGCPITHYELLRDDG